MRPVASATKTLSAAMIIGAWWVGIGCSLNFDSAFEQQGAGAVSDASSDASGGEDAGGHAGTSGSGGASTGGASAGGTSTGGASTGGASTGGASTGGASTGGASTGGASTGGATTGGAAGTGAMGTGGAEAGSSGAGSGGCPSVHDEDSDQIDDACDKCPSVADPAQLNGDSDGIGDACEWSGDAMRLKELMFFESWLPTSSGIWAYDPEATLQPDELWVSRLGAPAGAVRAGGSWQQSLTGRYAVETTFHYRNSIQGEAGVRFGGTTAEVDNGYNMCVLIHEGNQVSLAIWKVAKGGLPQTVVSSPSPESSTMGIAAVRKIRVLVDPPSVICEFSDDKGDVAVLLGNGDDLNLSGWAGVGVRSADATFTSFVAYE